MASHAGTLVYPAVSLLPPLRGRLNLLRIFVLNVQSWWENRNHEALYYWSSQTRPLFLLLLSMDTNLSRTGKDIVYTRSRILWIFSMQRISGYRRICTKHFRGWQVYWESLLDCGLYWVQSNVLQSASLFHTSTDSLTLLRNVGSRWTSNKVRGALVHKRGQKYQHDWLYHQSINSIINQ